jgi:hypothetical protein
MATVTEPMLLDSTGQNIVTKLNEIKSAIQNSGGGGGGGHTIEDGSGTSMEQRANLQFIGVGVSDDSTNDKTIVSLPAGSVYTPSIGTVQGGDSAAVSATVDNTNRTVAYNFTLPKGDKGDTGDTGATGPTGPSGAKGDKGDKGDTGAQGPQGIQGPAGQDGVDGTDGQDGVTPVITATATVSNTTGIPSVNVNKTGTDAAPNFAFEFTNIKGDTGSQGPQGNDGADGTDGQDGADGVGIDNIAFKETDASGNNVYTITLDNGNSYDFTAPKGPQGAQGATGPQGPTGPSGGTVAITTSTTDPGEGAALATGDLYIVYSV